MSTTHRSHRGRTIATAFLFVLPLFFMSAPAASGLEGCSNDPADYDFHPSEIHVAGGDFELWISLGPATQSDAYCVRARIRDTTNVNSNCFDGLFDFVNVDSSGQHHHYDSRQFISCDQGNWHTITFKDNEDSHQYNQDPPLQDYGVCTRTGAMFGAFDNCSWNQGGGGLDNSGNFPRSPSSPNKLRGDFFTWGGAGGLTCYNEGDEDTDCAW